MPFASTVSCAAQPDWEDGAEPVPAARLPAPKRRDEMALDTCECLIDIGSALFSLPGKDLRKSSRSALPVSRVRQIMMYVAHVMLKLSMKEVGRGFGRDRTTVLHACQIIEEMREDPDFDQLVMVVERIAHAAFRDRLGL